ncbi:hypothetical protein QUB60_12850 [Microcoleus sp. A2-C5]|uniref:hypothetical protein n=1 Tax=unclassified Microcoleus TaxID=2642155 RepID=UPI002FCE98F4
MPKERDFLVRAIESWRWMYKHLYSESWGFWGLFVRAIARQTPALDGTMSFRLGLWSDRVNRRCRADKHRLTQIFQIFRIFALP